MITEEEFIKANQLKDTIDMIIGIIDSRKNNHVRSAFGICNLYKKSNGKWEKYGPNDDSSIDYFQSNHQDLMNKINDLAFSELEKALDEYVSQYRELITTEKDEVRSERDKI